jgi:hypothetical protein
MAFFLFPGRPIMTTTSPHRTDDRASVQPPRQTTPAAPERGVTPRTELPAAAPKLPEERGPEEEAGYGYGV